MGKLLWTRIAKFYPLGMGCTVILDRGDKILIPDGTAEAVNLVIVATPISEIAKTLQAIIKINPKHTFVTEIGSVKGGLWADYMGIMTPGNPTLWFGSTHPMVGPLAKDWDVLDWKRKCIVISGKTEGSDCHPRIAEFWNDLGFVIAHLDSAKRHDEIIGKLSHLSHYMIMMYARFIKATLTPQEIDLAGTSFETFNKMAEGAERLIDIYEANRSLPAIVDEFITFMKR